MKFFLVLLGLGGVGWGLWIWKGRSWQQAYAIEQGLTLPERWRRAWAIPNAQLLNEGSEYQPQTTRRSA